MDMVFLVKSPPSVPVTSTLPSSIAPSSLPLPSSIYHQTTTVPSPPPVYGPPTYDQYLETKQWLPPDDVVPPPISSLRPHSYMLPSYIPPPLFTYHQTTTIPLPPSSRDIPETVLPPRKRSFTILPSPSDPYEQAAAEASDQPKARRRVDARRWSFIPHTLGEWRYEEESPSTFELGESSSMAATRVLPVTREPIHHTIPLLIARMVRHEVRIDRVYDHLDELPLERIETIEMDLAVLIDNGVDIQQTVAGLGTTLDHTLEQALRDQLEIARARITELEEQGAGMRQEISELRESIQHERHMRGRLTDQRILDHTRITTLERTAEEAQSRQRQTDDIIAGLTRHIRELQCRLAAAMAEYESNRNSGNGGEASGTATRVEPAARRCTYREFSVCQPQTFSGTEGAVGLVRWFEKLESVFRMCTDLSIILVLKDFEILTMRHESWGRNVVLCVEMIVEEVLNMDQVSIIAKFLDLWSFFFSKIWEFIIHIYSNCLTVDQGIHMFSTSCYRCKMSFQYPQMYVNQTISCRNCHTPFMAAEMLVPMYTIPFTQPIGSWASSLSGFCSVLD
ncbi:retrotransposon gag domain-containing protein [Artemisia annua]|uniref:Retrotransposon gag domain-containing protein n=1 Tax=Artemisia annua TaxID=35608 RepID=A0A2U1QFZ0_ARTAN|nr:retrotransposon gag domain-containing protein [Artemisia annua]